MTDLSVTILTEKPEDAPAIERLHERTFGPGRFVRTSERIRERIGHELNLSYTACIGTLMVGSVRLTPICIGDTPALLLGPLTIEPPFRDRGIGKAMMERALKDAKEKGYKLVVLVGDVPYYARVGFKRVPNGAIKMPGPADPARILAAELTDGALTGVTGVVRPDWDSQKDSQ
jgi:predicted N-acetyltransferase YhbS